MIQKLALFICLLCISGINAQEVEKKEVQIAEVACGQCQFGMTEKNGCDLAIRVDKKTYFTKGTSIDDHGDAHGQNGFCNSVRKAAVIGEIKDNYFVITYFKLID